MNKSDQRKFIRIPSSRTIKIAECGQEKANVLLETLTSVNLSENGILFDSTKPYPVGKHYILKISGKDDKVYDARIEIIRVKEVITKTHYRIGARFIAPEFNLTSQLTQ
ncbi:MAG: PilZ domain-containing protein [Desulfobacterales bacterium]|nr:PilZ domain-containing protein [Desulfobacterales bacterium]